MRLCAFWFALIGLLLATGVVDQLEARERRAGYSETPVVRVVLFWSAGCPACHVVIDKVLPPIQQAYGERLVVGPFEMSDPGSVDLYSAAARMFELRPEQLVVPLMIIGEDALVGVHEIRDRLPGLVKTHLEKGGLDWPALPGLKEKIRRPMAAGGSATPPGPAEVSASPAVAVAPYRSILQSDPAGLALALAVMAGMAAALIYTGMAVLTRRRRAQLMTSAWMRWGTPVLAVAGFIVAGYLAYVETQGLPAVCGPVGDCHTVQGSPYARILGVVPVAVLGAAGYLAILGTWLLGGLHRKRAHSRAALVVFGIALIGTLFSLYLTYLEPFVIGAVCIWCLGSAAIVTLILVASVGPAIEAIEAR